MKEITINSNDAGQRLDKFLIKYLTAPGSMIYKGIRKNCVRINGKHIKDGAYMLKTQDVLSLYFKDEFFPPREEFKPIRADIDIVYEDNNILIINKPQGLVVHADDKGSTDTLIDRVKSYLYNKGEYNPLKEQSFAPALANRLDRNTCGLILAAKNAPALRELSERIRNRDIKKYYTAISEGKLTGTGHLENYITRDNKISEINSEKNGKKTELIYKALEYDGNNTVLEIELLTGRTHQIRAQLAHIGHPLAGDVKYGGGRSMYKYQALCASRLIFCYKPYGGCLDYMAGMEFTVSPSFCKSS